MRTASHGIRLLPGAGRGSARHEADRLVPTFLALAMIAALVAVVASAWSERRGILALPREQRTALLSRSVDDLRQFCGPARPDALRDHCRELASFAALFEECRGSCDALVRRELTSAPAR